MVEYIDRKAVLSAYKQTEIDAIIAKKSWPDTWKALGENLKSIPAVEVVRCKDCKNNGACSIQDAMSWTPRTEIVDYFCSYGERKNEQT